MTKTKKINLYCPLHGTQLEDEKEEGGQRNLGIYCSRAKCRNKDGEHTVYITDKQSYSQEGIIEIVLS